MGNTMQSRPNRTTVGGDAFHVDPFSGVRDMFSFLGEAIDGSPDEQEIEGAIQTLSKQGKTPEQMMEVGLTQAQTKIARDVVGRRAKAQGTWKAEMDAAGAESRPTGGQEIAGFIAEALNGLRGGNPGDVMLKLRSARDQRRAAREKRATGALATSNAQIDAEQADQDRTTALEAQTAYAEALATKYPNIFTLDQARRSPQAVITMAEKLIQPEQLAQMKAEAQATQARERNETTMAAAGRQADGQNWRVQEQIDADLKKEQMRQEGMDRRTDKTIKGAQTRAETPKPGTSPGGFSPRQQADAQKTSEELVPAIRGAREKITLLREAQVLHKQLFTGPLAGRAADAFPSKARQKLDGILPRIRVTAVPKGQGGVSDAERRTFERGVPGAENEAAGELYDLMIQDYEQAIADDEARLTEMEKITGRPTPRGAVPPQGGGGGTIWYSVPGQGRIQISPDEEAELLEEYPNAQRVP